jgi:hypothetical protein
MVNKKTSAGAKQRMAVSWVVAILLSPLINMIVLQALLQVDVISRVSALLIPQVFFPLIALLCQIPLLGFLYRLGSRRIISPAQFGAFAACSILAYSPALILEYFYSACFLFNDCHKL